jgi:CTP:phosphocholine cytidylyltransferase-like protein/aminoglycoside phosphotransferase
MTQNEFNLLYTIKKYGLQSCRKMSELSGLSTGYISQATRSFRKKAWINSEGITAAGITALLPYKLDNAVIMAAGMSPRFVPISLEKPMGLTVIKNQTLIERQIEQLQEAGIKNIILVLGYKKEAFFYLESKYEGITIVINPEYNVKHNCNSLYLAKEYLKNSYICSSDNYFEENPFEEYVYRSFYASVQVTEKTDEWYLLADSKMNISKVEKSGDAGYIMLGHAYWDREFSRAMVKFLKENHETGSYDRYVWEQILADHIKDLPEMEIKLYPAGTIFEFDSLDELRQFDHYYVNDAHSKIMRNIAKTLDCNEQEINHFEVIKEGLTNTSFVFELRGKKYVYRHPGEGTEAIISRRHEKQALELARSINIDPSYIYMDEDQGWKISHFVEGIRSPSYDSFEDSKRILEVLRNLHQKNLSVDWEFRPWEDAAGIEEILRTEKGGIADREFDRLKDDVHKCYRACQGDGVSMRFCHCDTYGPNWMLTDKGDTILIDWEYAGNADPGCDLGAYIMDAMWDVAETEKFIAEYCQEEYNDTLRFHYLAYTALISYYWYVWALYREACGAVMGASLYNWHVMAKKYSKYLVEEYKLG